MRNATTFSKSVSLGGRRLETTRVISDITVIENFTAFENLGCECGVVGVTTKTNRRNWGAWTKVPKTLVVISPRLHGVRRGHDLHRHEPGRLRRAAYVAEPPDLGRGHRQRPLTEDKHPIGTVTTVRRLVRSCWAATCSSAGSRAGWPARLMSPVCCREVATEVEAAYHVRTWAQERAGDFALPATDCTHLIVYPLKVAISDKDRSRSGAGPRSPRGSDLGISSR